MNILTEARQYVFKFSVLHGLYFACQIKIRTSAFISNISPSE